MNGIDAANINFGTLEELPVVSRQLLDYGKDYKLWLFRGEMGAGKTTLIKSICNQLNVVDQVTSPTFSIVNEYLAENGETLYHFDFYRIKNDEEAVNIGIDEYFSSGNLCLVEWPEKIENLIPEKRMEIEITVSGNRRTLQLFKNEK